MSDRISDSSSSTDAGERIAMENAKNIDIKWIPDMERTCCNLCQRPFTLMLRRHHCRSCGEIFCNSCSKRKVKMCCNTTTEIHAKPHVVHARVCGPCFDKRGDSVFEENINEENKPNLMSQRTVNTVTRTIDANEDKPQELNDQAQMPLAAAPYPATQIRANRSFSDLLTNNHNISRTHRSKSDTIKSTHGTPEQSNEPTTDMDLSLPLKMPTLQRTSSTISHSVAGYAMTTGVFCLVGLLFIANGLTIWNPAMWIFIFGFIKNLREMLQYISWKISFLNAVGNSNSLESNQSDENTRTPSETLSLEDSRVIASAEAALLEVTELLKETDQGWQSESCSVLDCQITSKKLPITKKASQNSSQTEVQYCKAWKFQMFIQCHPEKLFQLLHTDIEQYSELCPVIGQNCVIKSLSRQVDIIHTTFKEILGGVISSRDFVSVRMWKELDDGGFLVGGASVHSHEKLPIPGVIRGFNGVHGFCITPYRSSLLSETICSKLTWIDHKDIKGLLPRRMVDAAIVNIAGSFLTAVREKALA